MGIFKNYYKEYQELKKEVKYFSYECYLKEERIRKLNKEYKELQNKYNDLIEQLEPKKKRGRPRKEVKND